MATFERGDAIAALAQSPLGAAKRRVARWFALAAAKSEAERPAAFRERPVMMMDSARDTCCLR
jgi:hypothetical protein